MRHQSEAILEANLIRQLVSLGYETVKIHDADAFVSNLKTQLEAFNETTFTAKEFDTILNHLAKGTVFDKAKTLRDRFVLNKEDNTSFYVRFFNNEDWSKNKYQVTNQVQVQGSFMNRYDVTILVNGLPLVQIELKRSGIEIKEAFNQINRYQRHSFWSNHGLFQYVQLFVISNGVNTKYLANNRLQSVKQTFFWADANNKNITGLTEFAHAFLNTDHLGKMISHYVVMNETFKNMMVLRPYQYFATEAIINQVKTGNDNGYIWHTTGSGKTLTSFKASQIIMDLPEVHKVVFVVDRKDLDYQTMQEFNSFKKGSVVGGIGGLKVYLGWGAGEGARAPSPLWVGLGGLGLPGTFGSEQSHVQVSVLLDPLFVDLDGEGSGQAQARGLVGEDAHQQGPAFEFLIEPFEHVR